LYLRLENRLINFFIKQHAKSTLICKPELSTDALGKREPIGCPQTAPIQSQNLSSHFVLFIGTRAIKKLILNSSLPRGVWERDQILISFPDSTLHLVHRPQGESSSRWVMPSRPTLTLLASMAVAAGVIYFVHHNQSADRLVSRQTACCLCCIWTTYEYHMLTHDY
jgi:hypothetical protein